MGGLDIPSEKKKKNFHPEIKKGG
jgi:hypothetical protein